MTRLNGTKNHFGTIDGILSTVPKGFSVLFGTINFEQINFQFSLDHPLLPAVPVDAMHI